MKIDFAKGAGLVPVVVQDYRTKDVLMLAYKNEESWGRTLQDGRLCFYSRSRKALWLKGETSGNFLYLKSYRLDCDGDTLLIQASPVGPVCHTGDETCFGARVSKGFSYQLEGILEERLKDQAEDSYTVSLARKGIAKVAQKVGEEATEVVIEALQNNDQDFLNESADLLYHYLLLLKLKGFHLEDVESILKERHLA